MFYKYEITKKKVKFICSFSYENKIDYFLESNINRLIIFFNNKKKDEFDYSQVDDEFKIIKTGTIKIENIFKVVCYKERYYFNSGNLDIFTIDY